MPAPVKRSPFRRPLPTLKCGACGRKHLSAPTPQLESRMGREQETTTRCLYCGRRHRLVDGRWVRA